MTPVLRYYSKPKLCCALSRLTLCNPLNCSPPGSSIHGDSPGKYTGVGCHFLLQEIFPTQGSNSVLPRCRWILDRLSHQGSANQGANLSATEKITRAVRVTLDKSCLFEHLVEFSESSRPWQGHTLATTPPPCILDVRGCPLRECTGPAGFCLL